MALISARRRISKTFSFDAAHQLPNHDGKCRHLHGHTYSLTVVLEGEVTPVFGREDDAPDEGMVVDFSHLNTVVKRHIIDKVDHKFMVPCKHPDCSYKPEMAEETEEISKYIVGLGDNTYTAPEDNFAFLDVANTTSELLAEYFLQVIHQYLPEAVEVRLSETPSTSAVARLARMGG